MKKIALLLQIMLCTSLVYAQRPGTLDSAFGTNGIVLSNLEISFYKTAVQSNGKIITVSGSVNSDTINLYRYNTDGTPDNTFGDNGVSRYGQNNFNISEVRKILVQPDDKIMLVGSSPILRFHKDGAIDSSFGTNGAIQLFFPLISDLVLQPDGKLLVSAYEVWDDANPPIYYYYILRFNNAGKPDSSFGIYGRRDMKLHFSSRLAIQADGKIIVAHDSYYSDSITFHRLSPDGNVDSSFGTNGKSTLIPAPRYDFQDIAVQPSGKIITVGGISGVDAHGVNFTSFLVARLTSNGRIDSSFYDDGVAPAIQTRFNVAASHVIVQPDGKIILGGNGSLANNASGKVSAIVRLEKNGRPDNGFGTNGIILGRSDSGFRINDMALAPTGKIVTCGQFRIDNFTDIASVVQYNGGNAAAAAHNLPIANNTIVKPVRIQLYPNPAADYVTVSGLTAKKTTIAIYDMNGKLIKLYTTQSPSQVIPVKDLPAGRYSVSISGSDNQVQVMPFLKP